MWSISTNEEEYHGVPKTAGETKMTETKAPQLTAMEKQTLDALIARLYAEPGFSDVTPSDLSKITTIPMNSLRGVLSSLVQKGIIWMEDDRGPMVVYLSEKYYHLHPKWGTRKAFTPSEQSGTGGQ